MKTLTTEILNSRKSQKLVRTIQTELQTREEESEPIIEGYFAVFNSDYDMGWDMHESIMPGAFSNTISDDVRALINHNSTLVLGRTTAHTLELREDSHGLWGRIRINTKDTDAMNLYERVRRGDVNQCSFGFDIISEETEFRDDDSVHFRITEVKLYEVSPCTFPAYEETSVSARNRETHEELLKRSINARKQRMLKKLKGDA